MNENKDFLIYAEATGSVRVSDEVISAIAYTATMETEGVKSTANQGTTAEIADFFMKKPKAKGIRVSFSPDTGCIIDVSIAVKYGCDITVVAQNVQSAVKAAVESMAQLEVRSVNIQVVAVSFEQAVEN